MLFWNMKKCHSDISLVYKSINILISESTHVQSHANQICISNDIELK